ncbi:MAG: low molecular weight phosphotyrosine protein phosphatase [Ruminococcaceae bacterium]|nr:low molecular weight phosphotyrosine protein phosphatase [Oscillospiraceae bacterium]
MHIMFVCHGNICRSPMAECILRSMLEQRGLTDRYTVSSSATTTEEIVNGVGNPVYPPAQRELAKHGLSLEHKRARHLKKKDYDTTDLFVGMDYENMEHMHAILGHDPERKIHLLMSFTERGGVVSDPWYTNRFDVAYRDIYEGCEGLIRYLLDQ